MKNAMDLSGQRYGRLLVLARATAQSQRGVFFDCLCDCGAKKIVYASSLRSGASQSCGCLFVERHLKHGMTKTPLYRAWQSMLCRCSKPSFTGFKNYGGRGISVCDRWLEFANFYEDMGNRPKGMELERVDNNKGYSLDNCKWASKIEQAQNRRTNVIIELSGERKCLKEWCKSLGVTYSKIRTHLRKGRTHSEAVHIISGIAK